MKRLSYWAKNHKWSARILIVISWIMLDAIAIFNGNMLQEAGIDLPDIFLVSLIAVFALCFIIYPIKMKGHYFSYIKHKVFDLILVIVSFLLVLFIANRPDTLSYGSIVNATVPIYNILPSDSSATNYKPVKEFEKSLKDENGKLLKWKERKKLLKEQVRAIKRSGDLSKGEKTMLVILSVIAAMGLLALVLSWSCSLSCSGYDGAAVLVGIGGSAIVILLLIVAIRGIYKKNRKKKIKELEEKEKQKQEGQ